MPYQMLRSTLRHISPWRLVLLLAVVYIVIRLGIPWLAGVGVPFWVRAAFLAMGPVVSVVLGQWLLPKRR